MKISKLFMGAIAVLGLASASFAQTTVIGVGSSAAFPSMAIAAAIGDPVKGSGPICGTNLWSISGNVSPGNPYAYASDTRLAAIPKEPGTLWVAWDDSTTPTKVCAYLSVDSVVGQRMLLGTDAGGHPAKLLVDVAAKTTAGGNKVSFIKDNSSGLPTPVYNAIAGQYFNVAYTDIRPEDGAFATTRACSPNDPAGKSGLGYGVNGTGGCGGVGLSIQSSYDQSYATVVPFALKGAVTTDPLSGGTLPTFVTEPIGAVPVMIVVNKNNSTNTVNLGNPAFSDISTQVASRIFDGTLGATGDINNTPYETSAQLWPIIREPISGTYNTFEWQLVRARDGDAGRSQETGVPTIDSVDAYPVGNTSCFAQPATATFVRPAVACANPLWLAGPLGTFRSRAIGTGQMASAINNGNQLNAIGYYFYSAGTTGGKTNSKYLTLGGVDPLYINGNPNGGNGTFPNCTGFVNAAPAFSCVGNQPDFGTINTSAYRVWSLIRSVYLTSGPQALTGSALTLYQNLIDGVQDQTTSATAPHDFLPYHTCANALCSSYNDGLKVFRSHYTISGVAANNGLNNFANEAGGDMAGAVFTDQAEREATISDATTLITFIQ